MGKLIYLYDNNHITLSAETRLAFTEDTAKRFEAYGWHVQSLDDGNDLEAIRRAIQQAKDETKRPSLILVKTHIGYGSPHKQDTFEAHGSPLGEEEVKLTKEQLGWPLDQSFYLPQDALTHFRKALELGGKAETEWDEKINFYSKEFSAQAEELKKIMRNELAQDWAKNVPTFPADPKGVSTRIAGGKILNAIAAGLPSVIGGSADLDPSTFTTLLGMGSFQDPSKDKGPTQGAVDGGWGYTGRNIAFGIREHGMASMLNGMAAHGALIPFGATFLTFSDYMRPSIRLAALMKLQVVFVFTHDSIALGEDGPTHQSVEHLAALRAIPDLIVIRPCDANETAAAWRTAIETRDHPTALILTRQNVPTLDRNKFSSAGNLKRGAYILADAPDGKPELILMATGSEVSLIVGAREKLLEKGIQARVVSMPSWELFEAQPQEYRDSVLLPTVTRRLAVEAGISQGWHKYAGDHGIIIGIDRFGASAPGGVVMREFGFTVEHVYEQALLLGRS